jgi:FkbM family methyltransferase
MLSGTHSTWVKRKTNDTLGKLGVAVVKTTTVQKFAALATEAAVLRTEARALRVNKHFVESVFGQRLYANPNDAGMSIHSLAGLWIDQCGAEMRFITAEVGSGQTALDLGANVGLVTLLLARLVGAEGRVYAFEPGPVSFGLLMANIAINGHRQVRAENAAVMNYSGEVDLFICRTGESDNRVAGTLNDHADRDQVASRCVSIDDYLPEGTSVDFIKMDIQGAEIFAMRGMERVLRESPNVTILIEYAPAGIALTGATPEAFLDIITGHGFAFSVLGDDATERPTTMAELLAGVGGSNQPQQINLVLRRR